MSRDDAKWCVITLRLFGLQLPLGEIEGRLDLVPSHIGQSGDFVGGKPGSAKYDCDMWNHTYTTDASIPLDEQLEQFVGELERRRAPFVELCENFDIDAELFIGFSSTNGQGGAHFSERLLSRISVLHLGITLDLYPPNDTDQ
jgi:hypothetical protein